MGFSEGPRLAAWARMGWLLGLVERAKGGLERGLGRLENHDAVVGSAIDDAEAARDSVQQELIRLATESERSTGIQDQLKCQIADATQQALAHRECNRERAITAVRKLRAARAQFEKRTLRIRALASRQVALREHLGQLSTRIRHLREQRAQLSAAERSTIAYRALGQQADHLASAGEALARWRAELARLEGEFLNAPSPLDAEDSEASLASLETELDALTTENHPFRQTKEPKEIHEPR